MSLLGCLLSCCDNFLSFFIECTEMIQHTDRCKIILTHSCKREVRMHIPPNAQTDTRVLHLLKSITSSASNEAILYPLQSQWSQIC